MAQLEIKDLRKTYDHKVWALDKVSFDVQKGDFIILLGLSGSGKSTLLRCINRLIEPDGGDVFYEGKSVRALSPTQLRRYRRSIAMVFQQFNLVKNLSVLTNVLTGRLGYHGLLDKYSASEIDVAYHNLDRVGLKKYAKRQVKSLSGGQQQRVAIARALMQNPAVVLADEPVASLDPATADSIMQYLAEINSEGISVLCSLHFLSLARRYGNRVVALKDGLKVYEGLPVEIDNARFKQIYSQDAEEV